MNSHEQVVSPDATAAAPVTVLIPSGLLRFTGQLKSLEVQAETVGQALAHVSHLFPLLHTQMFASDGRLRGFINIFVNSQDIRFLQKEQTPLRPQDVITILPAIAGG